MKDNLKFNYIFNFIMIIDTIKKRKKICEMSMYQAARRTKRNKKEYLRVVKGSPIHMCS